MTQIKFNAVIFFIILFFFCNIQLLNASEVAQINCELHDGEKYGQIHFTYMMTREQGILAHTIACKSTNSEMITLYKFYCVQTFSWQLPSGMKSSITKLHDRVLIFPKTKNKTIQIILICGTINPA